VSLSEALPVRLAARENTGFDDEDRLPERMVERIAGGSLFHKEGPMDTRMRNCVYIHTWTHIHTCLHTYIYIHIHTHVMQ